MTRYFAIVFFFLNILFLCDIQMMIINEKSKTDFPFYIVGIQILE